MKRKLILLSTAALCAFHGGAALAQSTTEADSDIVVTARLRTELLQNVPVAITAITEKNIERAGIRDLGSLAQATAGLQMDSNGNKRFTSPIIRGVSQVSRIDDENNVPMFIDGVYVSGREGIDANMVDVERIEVVKGPQSALYGRSSYSGSINIITKKPTSTVSGSALLTLGDGGRITSKASISGPIVDGLLYARFAAAHDETNGTYGKNGGLRIGGYNSNFFSGGLRLVHGGFEALGNLFYSDDRVGPSQQILFAGNCELISGKFGAWCGQYPTVSNPDFSGYDRRAWGSYRGTLHSSLTLTQQIGQVKLTSLTGYNSLKISQVTDWDRQFPGLPNAYTLAGVSGTANITNFNAEVNDSFDFNQEVRLESAGDSPLQWLVGASYYKYRQTVDSPFAYDSSTVPAGASLLSTGFFVFPTAFIKVGDPINLAAFNARFGISTKRTRTEAVFGSLQYTLGTSLTARAEVRYTSEHKELTQIIPAQGTTAATFKYWTPRFTLDYKPNDDMLLYASVAKGAKAGGFNASAPKDELAFGPEFNWTYEVGVKASLFERRLQVNLAAFEIDMNGIQVTNSSPTAPTVFVILNAGKGRSRGFELELLGKPIDGLTLQASYSLADAKFTDARDGSLRSYPTYRTNYDVSGNPLPRQSKHLVNASAQYEFPVTDKIGGYFRIDGRYESKRYGFTVPRLGWVGGRVLVNAKAGMTVGGLDASLWVRNLTNNKTPTLASNTLTLNDLGRTPMEVLPEFRSWGLTLSRRF